MERGEGMGGRLRGISGPFERSCCIQQVASKGEMVYVKCRVRKDWRTSRRMRRHCMMGLSVVRGSSAAIPERVPLLALARLDELKVCFVLLAC